MRLSTGPLAASSARHPWPVVGAWVAVAVLAIIAIAMFLEPHDGGRSDEQS